MQYRYKVDDAHCDIQDFGGNEGVICYVQACDDMSDEQELNVEVGKVPVKLQEGLGDSVWLILLVLELDQPAVYLEVGQDLFFLFDDHLVKDSLKNDDETDRKDSDDLNEEALFVRLDCFAVFLLQS